MNKKFGTSQGRLNYATDYAREIMETTTRLEHVWQLGNEGVLSKEQATNGIKNHIAHLDQMIEEFQTYYSWREDMEKDGE